MNHDPAHAPDSNRRRSISRWVFVLFAAIAGFFLVTEHRAHLYGILPYLLLAACPLLHLLHHRGHGGGGGDGRPASGHGAHRD